MHAVEEDIGTRTRRRSVCACELLWTKRKKEEREDLVNKSDGEREREKGRRSLVELMYLFVSIFFSVYLSLSSFLLSFSLSFFLTQEAFLPNTRSRCVKDRLLLLLLLLNALLPSTHPPTLPSPLYIAVYKSIHRNIHT